MIDEIFKNCDLKVTKQRKNVYQTILDSKKACTFKYIKDNCQKDINKVTLYRIIDTFLEKGLIIKKISLNNEVYYEITNTSHTHYITCPKCNEKKEIPKNAIELFEKQIIGDNKVIFHQIDFYVLCNKCKKI